MHALPPSAGAPLRAARCALLLSSLLLSAAIRAGAAVDFRHAMNEWVMGRWEKEVFVPEATSACDGGDWARASWRDAPAPYHMFSQSEARSCLESKRGIAVSGDSYMVGLYVGMIDMVTGERGHASRYANQKDGYRVEAEWMRKVSHVSPPLGFRLKSYYGKWGPSMLYKTVEKLDKGDSKMMRAVGEWKEAGLLAYNALMHDAKEQTVKRKGEEGALREYKENVKKFARHMKDNGVKLLWVTGPAQDLRYVFSRYQKFQNNHRMLRWNTAAIEACKEAGVPFLDGFHMGALCTAQGCFDGAKGDKSKRTLDGHHRSRFFNRMRAQCDETLNS